MSGPWDRPSSPDADDRDSGAQDRESPPDHAQSAEPWSPTDPWGEGRASEPGWDAWPPPSPPPDDYFSEPGSSHDLWSEPWEEEAAALEGLPSEPIPEPEPAPYQPEPEAYEPEPAPYQPEPEAYEPEPAPYQPEPEAYEPEPPAPESPAADEPAPLPAWQPAASEPPSLEAPSSEPGPAPSAFDEPEPYEPYPDAVEHPEEASSSEPDETHRPAQPAEPYLGVPYEPEPHETSFVEPGAEADATDVVDEAETEAATEAGSIAPWAAVPATDRGALPDWLAEPPPDWPTESPAATGPAIEEEAAVDEAPGASWLDASAAPWDPDAVVEEPMAPQAGPEPIAQEPIAPEPGLTGADDLDAVDEAGDEGDPAWGVAGAAVAGAAAGAAAIDWPEAPAAEVETPVEVVPEEIELDAEPEPEGTWPPPFLEADDESTRVLPTDWTPPPAPPAEEELETADLDLEPRAGDARTGTGLEPEDDADVEPGSTAEQAVPWLIGLVLLLAGMVIVLLALIFAGDGSLGGSSPEPSPSLAAVVPTASATPSPTPAPSAAASASAPAATPTPAPLPVYGPLEMIYQGRAAALAPIYLLLHDFTTEDEAMVLAQDPTIDVRRFAWAPDGTVGAGLLADVLVSIEIGESKRNLGEGLTTLTFGGDRSTLYAVRVTADGGNDTATVVAVDFASGESSELASVTYPRPSIGNEPPLQEAQFTDDGGTIRLYWMHDGTLRLWVLGASTWTIDPESGEATDLEGDRMPTLLNPGGTHLIELTEADDASITTLHFMNVNGNEIEATSAPGLISHVRWSPNGDRIVFTVGRAASGGGVLQDLFLWDLDSETPPMQITNTGAAFGAVWRGTQSRWEDT